MPIPAEYVTYGPGDFDPPDLPDYEDDGLPDSEREYLSLLATMPEEADEEPVTLYGTRDYSPAFCDSLPVVNWCAPTPEETRREEIRAFNARHALLQRRHPRACFRFELPGQTTRAYLYADAALSVPLAAGVSRGADGDALRTAASRAMQAAGIREESRPCG